MINGYTEAGWREQIHREISRYIEKQIPGLVEGRHFFFAGFRDSPRLCVLYMRVHPEYATAIAGMAVELSMATGMPPERTIRIGRGDGGGLVFEIPKPPPWPALSADELPPSTGLAVPLGIEVGKQVVLVDFKAHLQAHLLVTGTTGSGKTTAIRLIAYKLAQQNTPQELGLVLIGDDLETWQGFGNLAHLLHPVTDETEAIPLLLWARNELMRRKNGEKSQYPPSVFVIIDEAATLLDDAEAVKLVTRLAERGRRYGFHIILAVQNPNAETLGSPNIKRLMPTRLVFRVDSYLTAALAAGRGDTKAELLIAEGDALLVLPSRTVRLTAAMVGDGEVRSLPQAEKVRSLPVEDVPESDLPTRGRKAEGIEPEHVAWWLAYPDASERRAYDELHIGYPRLKAARAFAQAVERAKVKLEGV